MNEIVEFIKGVFALVKDYFEPIIFMLAVLGVAVDFTPWIKVNPIRSIFRKIASLYSNYLTKVINDSTNDIRTKLDEQEGKIDNVCTKLSELEDQSLKDKIKRVRWEILDFGNAIEKRDYDKDMYDHIIEQHDWYESTIEQLGIPNGKMDITYPNIVKKYNEKFCS